MHRFFRLLEYFLCVFFLLISFSIEAQTPKRIYYFKIDEDIAKPAVRKTKLAMNAIKEQSFDCILMEINTFGGELASADAIRTLLLESPIPVFAFINNNAASAGALISIACDSIYMAPGASIGAASVVNQSGEIMPDKYQSYMRSLMRATAEKKGRDPMIAEAMVDPDIEVENISKKGKVLTFTTQEAMANGYCEGSCHDRAAVLLAAGIRSYEVEEQQLSWIETFINFLVNPVVSGILIMMMVGGIYFELQTPGIGFAGLVALLGAILYFAPHYLQGLAAHWEILLFVVGLILLIIELFAFPGFGFFGISGIVIMVVALVLAMVFNVGFDFHFTSDGAILLHFINVMTALMLGFFLSLWLSKKVFMLKTRYGAVALDTELSEGDGFTSVDASMKKLIGAVGVTKTFMRPAGKVEIDGDFYDAISENGVIEPNVSIVVVRFENAQLVVHPHVED